MYTDHGIIPDPAKVNNIKMIPTPETKEDLQRFLGLMTNMSSYIPNYSAESEPLRELPKKDVLFLWDSNHV